MTFFLLLSLAPLSAPAEMTAFLKNEKPVPLYIIKAKICEGDPAGSRQAGTFKVLAEPTLAVMEKKEASFFAGGEFHVEDNQFQEFGLKINITPHAAPGGQIRLKVLVDVNQILEKTRDHFSLTGRKDFYSRTVKPGEIVKLYPHYAGQLKATKIEDEFEDFINPFMETDAGKSLPEKKQTLWIELEACEVEPSWSR